MERAALSRLTAAAVIVLVVVAGTWGLSRLGVQEGPEAAPMTPRVPARAATGGRASTPPVAVGDDVPAVLRDLFSYRDESSAQEPSVSVMPPVDEPEPAERVEPLPAAPALRAVRLVGFVQQGGRLRAALSVRGEVVLVGGGERAGEFSVLALDEDAGVLLRGPDGAELRLAPD